MRGPTGRQVAIAICPARRGRQDALGRARYRLGCGKLACVATVGVHGFRDAAAPNWRGAAPVRSKTVVLPLACLGPQ